MNRRTFFQFLACIPFMHFALPKNSTGGKLLTVTEVPLEVGQNLHIGSELPGWPHLRVAAIHFDGKCSVELSGDEFFSTF